MSHRSDFYTGVISVVTFQIFVPVLGPLVLLLLLLLLDVESNLSGPCLRGTCLSSTCRFQASGDPPRETKNVCTNAFIFTKIL